MSGGSQVLAPCFAGADVLYLHGSPDNPIFSKTVTATQTDSMWDVRLRSVYGLDATIMYGDQGFELWLMPLLSPTLVPGTYALGAAAHGQQQVSFDFAADGLACGLVTGTVTLLELTGKGDAGSVGSLLLWFSVYCASSNTQGSSELQGCVRYNG